MIVPTKASTVESHTPTEIRPMVRHAGGLFVGDWDDPGGASTGGPPVRLDDPPGGIKADTRFPSGGRFRSWRSQGASSLLQRTFLGLRELNR
jgi:hypothetical protein